MTTYATQTPATIDIEIAAGSLHVAALDRADTAVDVQPSNPNSKADRATADATKVELDGARLRISGQGGRAGGLLLGRGRGSVRITIEAPDATSLHAALGAGDVTTSGALADCAIRSGAGDIAVERASAISVRTGSGDVEIGHASGEVDVKTGSGQIRLGQVSGAAALTSSSGAVHVAEADGPLRVATSNGAIEIGAVHDDVVARSSNGNVSVDSAANGNVELKTSSGRIEIGVPAGPRVWVDAKSSWGTVHNELEAAPALDPATDEAAGTVRVTARTSHGDIRIRRPKHAPVPA